MSDVQRTAFRFTDAALEDAYLSWAAQQAQPLIRVGMIAATINYGLVFAAGALGRPEHWELSSALTLVVLVQAGRTPSPPQSLAACLAISPARRPQMDQVCTVLQSRR